MPADSLETKPSEPDEVVDIIEKVLFLRRKEEDRGGGFLHEVLLELRRGDLGAWHSRVSSRVYPAVLPTGTSAVDVCWKAAYGARVFISWYDSCRLSKNFDMPPRCSSTTLPKLLFTCSGRYADGAPWLLYNPCAFP
jgi:hypothetical protein